MHGDNLNWRAWGVLQVRGAIGTCSGSIERMSGADYWPQSQLPAPDPGEGSNGRLNARLNAASDS